jgi:WD40 repeat protein
MINAVSILIVSAAISWPAEPERTSLTGAAAEATSFAISPDGTRVAATSESHARVWDANTGNELFAIEGPGAASVAFRPDGTQLAVAWDRDHPAVYDAENGRQLLIINALDAPGGAPFPPRIVGVAFSPDARWLATAGSTGGGGRQGMPGGVVKVWELKTRTLARKFTGLPTVATAIAFSPDGRLIAAGSSGIGGELPLPGQVDVWERETGERRHTLMGKAAVQPGENRCAVTSVAFSPDSRRLAWADSEGTVRVRDLPSGAEAFTLSGHTGWVRAVAFSPRGDRLASGGDDGSVCLWDLATGQRIKVLAGHSLPIQAVAFSADGQRIESAGGATSHFAPGIPGLFDQDAPESRTSPGKAGEVFHWNIASDP